MTKQTSVPCPVCGRLMRPGGLPKHVRSHGDPRSRLWMPPEIQDEVVRLYARGRTIRQIAAVTFYAPTTVRSVLQANNVKIRPRAGYPTRKISNEEILRRCELYGRGLSLSEVAEVCGCAVSSVHETLKRAGTPRRSLSESNRLSRKRRDDAWRNRSAPAAGGQPGAGAGP
jgi:lambda repressor-like predicted transcriptional regulator